MSRRDAFLSREKTEDILSKIRRIHFVGALGAGMLPLAKLCRSLGYEVTGSDARADEWSARKLAAFSYDPSRCEAYGDADRSPFITPITPHAHGLLSSVDMLVASFAVPVDAPEMTDARELGIPVISRAELLGALMTRYERRVGICGSHGKSTTTALVDKMLCAGGVSHTTVSGATLFDGCDARIEPSSTFVYEACEYRDAFLRFHPTLQVVTSIELDHTDYFADIEAIRRSFLSAADRATAGVILNADFVGSADFARRLTKPITTYGMADGADYRYILDERGRDGYRFRILKRGLPFLSLTTLLIGEYNLANITAAVAAADMLGVSTDHITCAVAEFHGIERRMSYLGRLGKTDIFYDYAHHPTEIASAISAVKERYDTCAVVFMPHTYSRTQSLWDEFITAFSKSDFTILLDIYPAREKMINGVTSDNLARAMGERACYADDDVALHHLVNREYGAAVLMGAGDMSSLVDKLKRYISSKE